MKPKTKKTLIIFAAVVAIAVIVWLVVRRYTLQGIIARLDLSQYQWSEGNGTDQAKRYLLAEARAVKQQMTKAEIEAEAEKDGLTFNKELVYWGAINLRTKGYFNVAATDDILQQLKKM